MKKLVLGIAIMVLGSINNIIMITISTFSCATNSDWYTQLVALGLRKPFNFSIVIILVGLALAIWGVIDTDK